MRAAVALFCAACAGAQPLPADPGVDLDAVLATWTESLARLDAATAGRTAGLAPQAPSPARDSALLAELTARLTARAASLRTETLLVPTWADTGAVALYADQDGDRAAGPDEALVASIHYDAGTQRVIAVDEQHPSLLRDLPVALPLGRATAYVYGRMIQTQRATGGSEPADHRRMTQPAGSHPTFPAR